MTGAFLLERGESLGLWGSTLALGDISECGGEIQILLEL